VGEFCNPFRVDGENIILETKVPNTIPAFQHSDFFDDIRGRLSLMLTKNAHGKTLLGNHQIDQCERGGRRMRGEPSGRSFFECSLRLNRSADRRAGVA
jgi:hypothetical protein